MPVGARLESAHALLVGALALGGCAYQPDSFHYAREPFRGVYVTVECLDLAIARRADGSPERNVIDYQFGNRCNEPVLVDLAFARVYGTTADGSEIDLQAFDPFNELRVLHIDGRAVGREAIDYPSGETLENVCVDAASIAHVYPRRWICLRSQD